MRLASIIRHYEYLLQKSTHADFIVAHSRIMECLKTCETKEEAIARIEDIKRSETNEVRYDVYTESQKMLRWKDL